MPKELRDVAALTRQPSASTLVVLTPKEVATRLKVSDSWLAKARMRGDGPPYPMFDKFLSNQLIYLGWA
jgi:hypothetical protein